MRPAGIHILARDAETSSRDETGSGGVTESFADRDIETRAGWPTGHEMIVQLRQALGMFAGAMPISPQRAWEEALAEVRRLRGLWDA